MSSLYKSLCGRDAIDAAMDIFYADTLADEHVNPLMDRVGGDDAQRGEQRIYLAFAFGAPRQVRMHDAHRSLESVATARN